MAVERDGAAVKRNGAAVERNGAAVKRNGATVKRVGAAVERSRRGEDTGGGRGQGHGRGHGTRTEDKDRGHGDSVNKLLRTDLRRAMAPIIYRNSSQRPQANTQPYSDAFHVSSCDPSFPHSVLHAIPLMRSCIPESFRGVTFPHLRGPARRHVVRHVIRRGPAACDSGAVTGSGIAFKGLVARSATPPADIPVCSVFLSFPGWYPRQGLFLGLPLPMLSES